MPEPDLPSCPRRPIWSIVAAILWGGALLVLLLRAGLHPHRPTSLTTYLTGGMAWNDSEPVYTNWRGFVYPPVVAWFFGMVARLPLAVSAIAWRLLTSGLFLYGLVALLRAGVFDRIVPALRGLVFIAVLPLSIGNIDNAQANPLVAGLMMLSIAAMQWESWTLCAIAIGMATMIKIYPVALALVLCLLRPRELWWRMAVVLLVLGLLPFAFQSPHYVCSQYQAWVHTRLADDRFTYPMKDAPLDLWYLMVRLAHLRISKRAYTLLQVLGGTAIAGYVWVLSHRRIILPRVLASMFLLVSVWMLLLGPATENQTYVVLAPAACLLAFETLALDSLIARTLAFAGLGLLLAGVARNSLVPSLKSPIYMAIQPVGALFLLAGILARERLIQAGPTPASPR